MAVVTVAAKEEAVEEEAAKEEAAKEEVAVAEETVSSEQLRRHLKKALQQARGELMVHVKRAAEEDAARRAEGEHLEEASKEHRLSCSARARVWLLVLGCCPLVASLLEYWR